jgi:hypothetical protein
MWTRWWWIFGFHAKKALASSGLLSRQSACVYTNKTCTWKQSRYSLRETFVSVKGVKLPLFTPWRYSGGAEVYFHSFFNSALENGGQHRASAALPSRKNPGNHQQQTGCAPEPVWAILRTESLAPAWIWTPAYISWTENTERYVWSFWRPDPNQNKAEITNLQCWSLTANNEVHERESDKKKKDGKTSGHDHLTHSSVPCFNLSTQRILKKIFKTQLLPPCASTKIPTRF